MERGRLRNCTLLRSENLTRLPPCYGRDGLTDHEPMLADYGGSCSWFSRQLTRPSQEYFVSSIGQVKRVDISYGPGGVSRGIATITFAHADSASKAFKELNGVLIDSRPIKVNLIVSLSFLLPRKLTMNSRWRSLLPRLS